MHRTTKLRITFVTPFPSLAGGIRVIATYAQQLMSMGHEVTIVYPGPHRISWTRRISELIRGRRGPKRKTRRKSHFDDLANVTIRQLEQFRPVTDADVPDGDVVIATWWETAPWVARLDSAKGAKVYFIQHDERVMSTTRKDDVADTWRLPMHKVVIAPWLADMASTEFGDDDVSVVFNAVDHDLFNAPPRDKSQPPCIGFMYASTAFKGLTHTLAAVNRAKAQMPDLRVAAFGSEEVSPDAPLPADAQFHYSPPQHTLRDIYAACDAWIMGSRCEGFGLPILEAMACRTPVIATPTGAAPELLRHGGGMLVDMDDVDDMVRAIREIYNMEKPAWRQMSDRGYQTAAQLNWCEASRQFEAALFHAIERTRCGHFQSSSDVRGVAQ